MTSLQSIPSLKYEIHQLDSVKVRSKPAKAGKEATIADLTSRCELSVDGGPWLQSTSRFWGSIFSMYGISASIFRFFSHQEVLTRICERRTTNTLRFCSEPGGRMLAVSSPLKEPISVKSLRGLVTSHEPREVSYDRGVASLTMIPRSGVKEAKIGPDAFRNEYVVDVPLDGYGGPSTYLSLLRLVCLNGAVARVPEFRSDVIVGKEEPIHALARALSTFDAEEGYSAIRTRYDVAQKSPASVRECLGLHALLKPLGEKALGRYGKAVGDLRGLYGMANLNELSDKRQRVLPAKCTVYDLINVASETSTHDERGANSLRLEAWIGSLLREEYDLEGVAQKKGDFRALFSDGKSPAGAAKA